MVGSEISNRGDEVITNHLYASPSPTQAAAEFPNWSPWSSRYNSTLRLAQFELCTNRRGYHPSSRHLDRRRTNRRTDCAPTWHEIMDTCNFGESVPPLAGVFEVAGDAVALAAAGGETAAKNSKHVHLFTHKEFRHPEQAPVLLLSSALTPLSPMTAPAFTVKKYIGKLPWIHVSVCPRYRTNNGRVHQTGTHTRICYLRTPNEQTPTS